MDAAFNDFPSDEVDGLLGVSFLSKFAAVEFGFGDGMLRLSKNNTATLPFSGGGTSKLLTKTRMRQLLGGHFTVDVCLGDRGPVTMVLDRGARRTKLNWRGVGQLGLWPGSKEILPYKGWMRGTDGVTVRMSHGIPVDSELRLGSDATKGAGVSLAGEKQLAIGIGDIPGIANMPVGGILGMDAIIRCGRLRCSWQEPFEVAIYE